MYCINCGANNLEAAKFCRKCGTDVGSEQSAGSRQQSVGGGEDGEVETRVAVRAGQWDAETLGRGESYSRAEAAPLLRKQANPRDEAEIFSISPTLMFVKAGYALAALGAILLAAVVGMFTITPWAVLFGLLFFLIPAYYHFRQKLVRYTLTESSLEMDSGFISRTTRNIPLRRIQDVTVTSTVMQRLLGFGDLVVDNAGEDASKVVLKNINTPKTYADTLLRQMRRIER